MAFGVESRVPFVDHRLVEWLASLAADMRLSGGWTKRILRESLIGILPEPVRKRKSKLGFWTPETEWLSGPLAGWLQETLCKPKYVTDMVDLGGVRALLETRNKSSAVQSMLLRLAVYESWARLFMQGPFNEFSKATV
jgi:asparagine synthase (glutamine-hydrolysing)